MFRIIVHLWFTSVIPITIGIEIKLGLQDLGTL